MAEKSERLTWGEVNIANEQVTEQDIKEAESSGFAGPGKYLVTVVESNPREAKLKEYTCIAANLKMKIVEVLKMGADMHDPQPGEGDDLEGKFIFDDVLLQHPKEKDGMRKRRILIARRFGLIKDTGAEITPQMWSKDILERDIIVTVEQQSYKDKQGNPKTSNKVAFDGYEPVEGKHLQGGDYSDI